MLIFIPIYCVFWITAYLNKASELGTDGIVRFKAFAEQKAAHIYAMDKARLYLGYYRFSYNAVF